MLDVLYITFISILICFFISYFSAPLVKYIGETFDIVDLPNYRKVHTKPVVRIGGISILISFFVCYVSIKKMLNLDVLFPEYSSNLNIILLGSFFSFLLEYMMIFINLSIIKINAAIIVAFFVSYNGISFPDINFYLPYFEKLI